MVLYKILVNTFQNLVKLQQKSLKFHNLTKFWLKLFETILKFSMFVLSNQQNNFWVTQTSQKLVLIQQKLEKTSNSKVPIL